MEALTAVSQHDFERSMASLHDAMLDDAHWPATSALIDKACGIKGSALVVGKGRSQTDGQIFLARLCRRGERYPECERWYFDLYYPWDGRVPRVAQLPDSRLVPVTELYTDQELKNSAAYNEGLLRGGYQHGLNVRLDGPDGSSIVWTLAESTERGGWGSAQIEMIERLLPRIRQYVQVRRALAGAEALGASLADLLDSTRVGVIHLDQRGGIVEANDRARGILRRGDGLFDQDGFLRARQPADHTRLETLLAGALRTHGSEAAASDSMTIRRPPGVPRLVVHIKPVDDRRLEFGLRHVAALVLVVDAGSPPRLDAKLVAEALGLTPAESQVAVMLSEGRTVRDIAMATGRQEGTVYILLKRAYKKLGISRQVDLVRLVLPLADVSALRR